jgi:hypothetical protein
LKKLASEKYNFGINLCYSQEGKKTFVRTDKGNETVRSVLIRLGEEERKKDTNVFIKKALEEIKNSNYRCIVISDFRFPNEYNYIKENTDYLVKTIKIKRYFESSIQDYSENALNDFNFDMSVKNISTEKVFYENIDMLNLTQY